MLSVVWQDWAIYWTLGNFLKPVTTINLPKSPTFLGNFCKGVEIFHFSREIIFGQLLQTFAISNYFIPHLKQLKKASQTLIEKLQTSQNC